MNQHNFQLSDFLKFLQPYFHTNKDQIMRYINELAPHTSEWDYLTSCSTNTKMDRDNFAKKCSLLERLFSKLDTSLDMFIFTSYEDDVELHLEAETNRSNDFKLALPLLKKFVSKHFPVRDVDCFDRLGEFNYGDKVKHQRGSYVHIYNNRKIYIRLNLNCGDPCFNFPSPVYLDACSNYA